jgi:hypothetical protein
MSTPTETQSDRERTILYVGLGVLTLVLVVIGLVLFDSAKDTKLAEQKADELIAALSAAGARTPDRDQVIRVLGSDGGATCNDPGSALARSILYSQLTNGAAGPGARPVIADNHVVRGQLLIIKIYCPDELDDFQDYVDDLKTDDVAE